MHATRIKMSLYTISLGYDGKVNQYCQSAREFFSIEKIKEDGKKSILYISLISKNRQIAHKNGPFELSP